MSTVEGGEAPPKNVDGEEEEEEEEDPLKVNL